MPGVTGAPHGALCQPWCSGRVRAGARCHSSRCLRGPGAAGSSRVPVGLMPGVVARHPAAPQCHGSVPATAAASCARCAAAPQQEPGGEVPVPLISAC